MLPDSAAQLAEAKQLLISAPDEQQAPAITPAPQIYPDGYERLKPGTNVDNLCAALEQGGADILSLKENFGVSDFSLTGTEEQSRLADICARGRDQELRETQKDHRWILLAWRHERELSL